MKKHCKGMLVFLSLAAILSTTWLYKNNITKLKAAEAEGHSTYAADTDPYPYKSDTAAYKKKSKKKKTNDGFVKRNNKTYYYRNGKKVTGYQKINGHYYIFSGSGIMRTGWYTTKKGHTLYLTKDGTALTGKKKISGKWYIFSPKAFLKRGWYKSPYTGHTYYTSPKTGVMKTGYKIINGNRYYFGKNGIMKTNYWYTNPKTGNRLFFGEQGRAVRGKIYYKGSYYIFDKNCIMQTGWYTTKYGTKYYLGDDGKALTGKQQIGKNRYIFSDIGQMQKGWYHDTKTGKDYYLNPQTGIMHIGKLKLNNNLYYFDETGALYRQVDGSKKMIALTFDDGPSPYTPMVLDTLEKNNAVATFFLVGNRVDLYKDYANREAALGCELANHTYEHAYLNHQSPEEIKYQVAQGNKEIKDATGVTPALMRPPGGNINEAVRENVGMPMILWSVDTEDWRTRNSTITTKRVLDEAFDGAIILIHDLHQSTCIASKVFIPGLIDKGYQLVTVSEMAELRNVTLEAGKSYFSFKPD